MLIFFIKKYSLPASNAFHHGWVHGYHVVHTHIAGMGLCFFSQLVSRSDHRGKTALPFLLLILVCVGDLKTGLKQV